MRADNLFFFTVCRDVALLIVMRKEALHFLLAVCAVNLCGYYRGLLSMHALLKVKHIFRATCKGRHKSSNKESEPSILIVTFWYK